MNVSSTARADARRTPPGPAFATHRVAAYLALAAALIDQLIR